MEQHHDYVAERWRFFHPKYRVYSKPLSVLPMIDMILIFIMFAIISSDFMLQPGIVLELPSSRFISGEHYGPLVVTLTQEGMVFFNDERTPIEGLALEFEKVTHKNKNAVLTIEADSRVQYGTVVQVMNMATDAGIREVNLATNPEFGAGTEK